MHKFLLALLSLCLLLFVVIGCTTSTQPTAFKCPMGCQVDTAYKQKGVCKVCEMDLEPIAPSDTTHYTIIN